MTMYNMLFGVNPLSGILLGLLNLDTRSVGRFRDAFVANGEIAIYTRNGGGNREHYDDQDPGLDCGCTGCIITYNLPTHPNYLRDEDDSFDSTYATVYFSIPDEMKPILSDFDTGEFDSDARWALVLETLKKTRFSHL